MGIGPLRTGTCPWPIGRRLAQVLGPRQRTCSQTDNCRDGQCCSFHFNVPSPGVSIAYQITPALIDFIIKVEGERLVAYLDTRGSWTVGVGHTGPDVTKGLRITSERSRALLQADLVTAATCVTRFVRVALTEPQWIALVSFVFNVGCRAFQTSTLLRLLNAGDYAAVPVQLLRWNKETVDGVSRINNGLTNRRSADIKQWNSKP